MLNRLIFLWSLQLLPRSRQREREHKRRQRVISTRAVCVWIVYAKEANFAQEAPSAARPFFRRCLITLGSPKMLMRVPFSASAALQIRREHIAIAPRASAFALPRRQFHVCDLCAREYYTLVAQVMPQVSP